MPLTKASPEGVALSLANMAITVAANAELLDSLAAALRGESNPRGYSRDWALDHHSEVVNWAIANLSESVGRLERFDAAYLS